MRNANGPGFFMPIHPLCPYCVQTINRTPRDAGICDSCGKRFYVRDGNVLTGRAARELDDAVESRHRHRSIEEYQAMMREFHEGALLHFQKNVEAFPFLKISGAEDDCSCPYCKEQMGKTFPTAQTTLAMIPPFAECASDYTKCRCTIIAIDRQEAVRLGLIF